MSKEPLLILKGMSKFYGVVHALEDVDFDLYGGEVHALMGENGAGKSTLAKQIAGIEQPTAGEMVFEGKTIHPANVHQAIKMGIGMVTQEFNSIPDMTVCENVFLGHEDMFRGGFIFDRKRAIRETKRLLAMFGMENQINPESRVSTLSVAEQQIVEIVKAVSYKVKILILDEPTASLSDNEAQKLFEVIRQLQAQNVGIILVTHRFNEIFEVSNRITVLRDGRLVLGGASMEDMTRDKLVKAMVGRDITDFFGKAVENTVEKNVILEVKNLVDEKRFLKNISFQARRGEILGISGLVGAGRTELVRCIFGADNYIEGEVLVEGKKIPKNNPRAAIAAGISLATENRKEEGLILDMSITENSSFVATAQEKGLLIHHGKERTEAEEMIAKFKTKATSAGARVSSLSGGNQQKVVLAKWLLTNPKILIVDEPTRGIDISAKSDIYTILKELAAQGICVIMVSSELPEIIGISDRILVMRDGSLVCELDNHEVTEERIMSFASMGSEEQERTA